MIRFYAPDIESDSTLPEVESGHCCRVLRMTTGDSIEVVDGKGNLFKCIITDSHPKHVGLEIVSKESLATHWTPNITLAVAPTKNVDRIEWLVEKAVEIGVNEIVFLNCKHSVRRVIKRDRIEKIMISAMKQSLKAHLPLLQEMTDFIDFISKCDSSFKFIGYCDDSVERKDFVNAFDGKKDVTIVIGPEGDFSPEEINAAFKADFVPVTFGNTRLRTETAALYALCATHALITQHQ